MIDQTRLHEKTVQKAASVQMKKPRKSNGRRPQNKMTVIKVDHRVMATAKQLARKRPGTKIKIINETTVIVGVD